MVYTKVQNALYFVIMRIGYRVCGIHKSEWNKQLQVKWTFILDVNIFDHWIYHLADFNWYRFNGWKWTKWGT